MLKNFMASLLCISLFLLTACHTAPPSSPMSNSGQNDLPLQAESQALDSFDSIKIDVLAADISVIPGEEWSVSYHLSDKEPLTRFGVEQGTLYIETTFDPHERFQHRDWFITVTVPAGTSLEDVELDTISGNVEIRGFSCDSASLSSTSGTVEAQDIRAEDLKMHSTSEKITVGKAICDDFEAETVSSDVYAEGEFGEMDISTVSGDTEVIGSVSSEGALESVSGDITLSISHDASIQANSRGTILLNGTKSDSLSTSSSGVLITIKSVSGDLAIQTTP